MHRGDPAPPPGAEPAAASATGRTRLRRRSSRRGPPPSFYPGPGLLLPHLDGAVVPLDGPARADLDGPAPPAQQVPIPGTVYCTPNLRATRSRIRASVHRWSCHPAASGPASSTVSSSASCASSSWQRAACPLDASPATPPASQARRHRRTDRSLTRSSAAITAAGTRCPNLSTASSRTCSRRRRPSAVNPPPCAYRIHLAYPRKPHVSAPRTSRIKEAASHLSGMMYTRGDAAAIRSRRFL